MKSALVLYPSQLFPVSELPEVDTVIMVEEPIYFGTDREFPAKFHKQKLILHRASMRRYAEEVLWPAKYDVEYIGLDVLYETSDIIDRAKKFDQIFVFDPINSTITKRLLEARRERDNAPAIQFLPSPNFYLKDQDIRQFFAGKHQNVFADFYQWQRERFNILISEDYKPVGGQWSFEDKSHSRVPQDLTPPSFEVYGDNKFVKEATEFVDKRFGENPGSTDFIWPTNHAEAAKWLQDFVEGRLKDFGPYKNAIDGKAMWLYHSALLSSLNTGLLGPKQVVEAAIKSQAKNQIPIESLEAFVRQILGHREFHRGLYVTKADQLLSKNHFNGHRRLTPAWYSGTTGIPPLDDVARKVNDHAYIHRAERIMVAGNMMLLAEIRTDEIYRWFNEMLVDAYDWMTLPFIHGLQAFEPANTGMRPAIAPSGYILQMSHYERGIWSDVWDGLFWRFIEKHKGLIKHDPSMRAIVQRFDRMDADHKRIIGYRADDFLTRYTLA